LQHRAAICADLERLPIQARSFDLIVCNLGAYWCAIDRLLPELLRVAAPGALLLFSTFGPDTLQELRAAFKGIDQQRHVMTFIDMHDIGDALGQTGFVEPIMQMDRLTLTYANLRQLTDELAALGMRNLLSERAPGLYGARKWQAMSKRYRADAAGLTPATFEIIYATAWKPLQAQRLPDGSQVIGFHPARKG
jgi:malonyl-CoA O-methyltransferase